MAARRRLAIAACSLLRPRMPMFSACMSSVRLLSTSQSPSADILNRRVPETGPLGPAEGSFMAQGTSKLVDTLYFRKLAAPKAGKSVLGAYTPDSFSGQVILAVNTASLCGLTPQLRQLQVRFLHDLCRF